MKSNQIIKPKKVPSQESTNFINTLFNTKETYVATVLLSFLDVDTVLKKLNKVSIQFHHL